MGRINRRNRQIKRNKRNWRRFLLVFVIMISIIFVKTSFNYSQKGTSNVVQAGDLSESILLMSEKSVTNVALKQKKEDIEIKKTKEIQEQKKKEIIKSKEREENNIKVAYLTFDDGPTTNITPQILNILDMYDVKATFFVIGELAENNPDIIKRINDRGHAIGNHSYSHNYKHIYKNTDNFMNDIYKSEKVFKNILGDDFETDLVRFPGGSFESSKAPMREKLVSEGYRYYDWNSMNGDAEGHNISKERLVRRLKETANGQRELVILMHDMGAKQTTADALPEIIEYLVENGYEFDTLK